MKIRTHTAFTLFDLLVVIVVFSLLAPPSLPTLFPYTTLFRSDYEAGKPPSPALLEAIGKASEAQAAAGILLEAGGLLPSAAGALVRSEEHTSELQSQSNLVCRPLLEKKNLPNNPRGPV